MRIIAGEFKSRTVLTPANAKTRPTTDRARESLFNVLMNIVDFEGMRVLDLFAGSGALGFEALSRGANTIVFVEQDRSAQSTINKNADVLGVLDRITLVRSDVFKALSQLEPTFDLILADAPYDEVRARSELPDSIFNSELLSSKGIAVIEHRASDKIQLPKSAELLRVLSAGEACFSILKWKTLTD